MSERSREWQAYRDDVWKSASINAIPDYALSLEQVQKKRDIPPISGDRIKVTVPKEIGQNVMFINCKTSIDRTWVVPPEIQTLKLEKEHHIPVVCVLDDLGDSDEVNAEGYARLTSLHMEHYVNTRSAKLSFDSAVSKAPFNAKVAIRRGGVPSEYLRKGRLLLTDDGSNFNEFSLLTYLLVPSLQTESDWNMLNNEMVAPKYPEVRRSVFALSRADVHKLEQVEEKREQNVVNAAR